MFPNLSVRHARRGGHDVAVKLRASLGDLSRESLAVSCQVGDFLVDV